MAIENKQWQIYIFVISFIQWKVFIEYRLISFVNCRYFFPFNNKKENIMPEQPFGNENTGEQSNNELDESSPAFNNEQSGGEEEEVENQSKGDDEEVSFY